MEVMPPEPLTGFGDCTAKSLLCLMTIDAGRLLDLASDTLDFRSNKLTSDVVDGIEVKSFDADCGPLCKTSGEYWFDNLRGLGGAAGLRSVSMRCLLECPPTLLDPARVAAADVLDAVGVCAPCLMVAPSPLLLALLDLPNAALVLSSQAGDLLRVMLQLKGPLYVAELVPGEPFTLLVLLCTCLGRPKAIEAPSSAALLGLAPVAVELATEDAREGLLCTCMSALNMVKFDHDHTCLDCEQEADVRSASLRKGETMEAVVSREWAKDQVRRGPKDHVKLVSLSRVHFTLPDVRHPPSANDTRHRTQDVLKTEVQRATERWYISSQ